MNRADSYILLIEKVNTFIRKYYLNNLLRGLILLGAGLFSAFIIITTLEYFGNFDTFLRSLLFYGFILLNIALAIWLVIPSLLAYLNWGKTLTHDEAAEIIGQHFGDVKDKLLNTLQLKKLASEHIEHQQLIEASINQKIAELRPVSFPSAIDLKQNRRYLKWVALPALVIAIMAVVAPFVLTESTRRLIHHNQQFIPAAPFQFIILNRNLSAIQGADYTLDVKLKGNHLPNELYIKIGANTFKLDKLSNSRFKYSFNNLQQNTSFYLSANSYNSAPYQITVNQKPAMLSFDVELNYPAYLHKKSEILANAGDFTVPAGTLVKWKLHTQNALKLRFNVNNTGRVLSPGPPNSFEHTEKIAKPVTYSLQPLNNENVTGDVVTYRINTIADELPAISVQQQADSVSSKALYFNGTIQDDHGFSSLTFVYHIEKPGEAKKTVVRQVKADLSQTRSSFFFYWNLKDLQSAAGGRISYYFEVADNDGINGHKKSRSPEQFLHMPTEKEFNAQLDASSKAVQQKMQSAIKMAGQLERETQRLNQLLLNKNTLSFDEKKQIEELLKKKAELNNLVKEIQQENSNNKLNRQDNQQQSAELQQKQQQMENLLSQLMDPKTQDLLKKLQDLLQNDQKDDTRDELSKMQKGNQSLKKELDRMLELYKQLDFEQKLDQNINQLNKLATDQQKLAEKTLQPRADKQQLQKEQQQLQKDFKDVKTGLQELTKANEQLERKTGFENPEQEQREVDQQMDNSNNKLQQNDRTKAAQAQKQAAQQLQKMAQNMRQQQQEGEQQENELDTQQLRELLKVLVNSSFQQEKIMQAYRNMSINDPSYITWAQKQKDVKDNLQTAEDSLYALSRRVPQIQSTVNQEINSIKTNIDEALNNLSDRRTPEAYRNQQYAMTAMNNLALMLSEALNQLQNAASGKGKGKNKQPSLSQLRQMQQQLNQNMQKMREQMQQQGNKGQSAKQQPGQPPGSNLSEQLARMARQQQAIRQQLEQYNREQNKDGTGRSGALDKISKQMEQSETDLVNKKITEEALNRQQQIQTRLLEAEKAEQEQDQDKQRESNAGKDWPPGYIKALQSFEKQKERQTEQIKTVPPALNFYYKQKIKRYFEQLNAK